MNNPISFENIPVYMFSYFNFKTNKYEYQWYNQKLKELSKIFSKSQNTDLNPQLDLLTTNTNKKEIKYRDIYQDLNYVNGFRIPNFRILPKKQYLDFLLSIYHSKKDLSEFETRLPESFKILKQSISQKISVINFQDSKFIAITLQTMDQEISPYNLI